MATAEITSTIPELNEVLVRVEECAKMVQDCFIANLNNNNN